MCGSFYEAVIYFMLYSFIGWLLEVAYAFYEERRFVNRGILAGPICPVYGFGTLLILNIGSLLKLQHPGLLSNIIFIILLTTVLEYLTGYMLETFLNVKAWDYSNEFCNIKGRICLKFSIFWGLLGCFLIYGLHPIAAQFINGVNEDMKIIAAFVLLGFVLMDMIKATLPRLDSMKQLKSRMRVSLPVHIFKL